MNRIWDADLRGAQARGDESLCWNLSVSHSLNVWMSGTTSFGGCYSIVEFSRGWT